MEKKTKKFKLDNNGIYEKIMATVKERLLKTTKSEVRISTEDYFPSEAFENIDLMNETIALLDKIIAEIKKMPKAFHVNAESETEFFSVPNCSNYVERNWISKIIIMPTPCEEWEKLSEKLRKFTGKALQAQDCCTERLFGKRDDVEVTSTRYLALSPEICKNIIQFLDKRGTKDSLEFEIKQNLDDADRYNGDGEDRESEYDAICYYYLHLTIKTPTGRLKAENSFYV